METRMENLRPNDFNRICRTCLSTKNLQTMTDVLISDSISIGCILTKYTQITVDSTDNLPKQICASCIKNVNSIYIFLSNCDSVNEALIECSVRFESNFAAKDCGTNKESDIPCTIEELGQCKIKEEPQETTHSQNSPPTVPEAVYIKEEPLDDLSDNWNKDEDGLASDQSDDFDDTSQETEDAANEEEKASLLPNKSWRRYKVAYTKFMQWHNEKQFPEITEEEILEYLTTKATFFRASTLSSEYSMLKSTLNAYHNLDISKFAKVVKLLQSKTVDYVPEKFKVLTEEQIETFLMEAPNKKYLMIKLALVIGISGALRRNEFPDITVDDIQEVDSALVIKVPDKKMNTTRVFKVSPANESNVIKYLEFYREYVALRPKHTTHRRFFVYYRDGKCSAQVVGINTFGKLPFYIAEYLGLPNPKSFTGHCFRSSAHTRWQPPTLIPQSLDHISYMSEAQKPILPELDDTNQRISKKITEEKIPEKFIKVATENAPKKRRNLKNPKKHVKTPAERSKAYRERLKKKLEDEGRKKKKKRPQSSTERGRDYRERQRLKKKLENEGRKEKRAKKLPKSSTERSRDFSERQKLREHEIFYPFTSLEPQPSTSAQIKLEEQGYVRNWTP